MVLYGNFSGTRKVNIIENPRKKYLPWNGKPMKGYLIISKGGRDYRIERRFKASDATDSKSI